MEKVVPLHQPTILDEIRDRLDRTTEMVKPEPPEDEKSLQLDWVRRNVED